MLESQINKFLSLPEVKIVRKRNKDHHIIHFEAFKTSLFKVLATCTTLCDFDKL